MRIRQPRRASAAGTRSSSAGGAPGSRSRSAGGCRVAIVRSKRSASPSTRRPSRARPRAAQPLDRRAGEVCTPSSRARSDDRVDQPLVAADDVAHRLAAGALLAARAGHPPGARPQIGGRQPDGIAVEARVQQRLARSARRPACRSGGAARSRAAGPRAPRSSLRSWHWATNQREAQALQTARAARSGRSPRGR